MLLAEAGWPLTDARDREFEVTGTPNNAYAGFDSAAPTAASPSGGLTTLPLPTGPQAPAPSTAPLTVAPLPSVSAAPPIALPAPQSGGGASTGALSGLLLDPQELDTLLVTDGLEIVKETSQENIGTASPAECLGTLVPVEGPVYAGSGAIARKIQQLRQPGARFDNDVVQAVVSFGSAADARMFVDTESSRWSSCAFKTVTASLGGGAAQTWQVRSPVTSGVLLSISASTEIAGVGHWACQRALAVQGSVVADVRICSARGSGQAPSLARSIAGRVTG